MTADLVLPGAAVKHIAYLLAGVPYQNGHSRLDRTAQDLVDLLERTPADMRPGVLDSALGAYRNKNRLMQAVLSVNTAAPVEQPKSWADLELDSITWTWPGRLANGVLTGLVAEQAGFKSTFALALLKSILLGDAFPDGAAAPPAGGKALWVEAEGSQVINRDRARKMGIPLDRILTPLADPSEDVRLDSPDHLAAIERVAALPDVRIIILDSVRAAHRGDENSSETIGIMMQLATLAKVTGRPIIVIHHLRKRGITDPDGPPTLDRLRGSSALTQPMRTVWAIYAPDPELPNLRRVDTIKSNLAAPPPPIGFQCVEGCIVWADPPDVPRKLTATDEATDWVREYLRQGAQPWRAVVDAGKTAGHSEGTLRRVRDRICRQRQGEKPPTWGLRADR